MHRSLLAFVGMLGLLVLACGDEGTAPRNPNACDGTRAQIAASLAQLVADGAVADGTVACGEGGVAGGMVTFNPAVSAQAVAQTVSYFANACAGLAGCE